MEESVSVTGNLSPAIPNTLITVYFTKPDKSVTDIQTTTSLGGSFNLTYTPDVAGNWTIVAEWASDNSLYSSASSDTVPMQVTAGSQLAVDYIYIAAIALLAIGIALIGFTYFKRAKK
jgi:hypothetical protein